MTKRQEYEAIFNHRGDSYAAAMRKYPSARDAEFRNLFRHVDLCSISSVADIPAGGGYLANWLPAYVVLDAYDPTIAFRQSGKAVHPVDLGHPELARHDYDLVVSLASLHHVADKAGFFSALAAHTQSGGQIVLADITAASRLVNFLDGFIGRHNGTGHDGMYFNPDDPFDFGANHERISRVVVETLLCPWRFATRADMVDFSSLLFGAATADPRDTERAIVEHVGVVETDGVIEIQWELTYITATLA